MVSPSGRGAAKLAVILLQLWLLVLPNAMASPMLFPARQSEVADSVARSVAGGYKNVAYFANWDIYGRNFQPAQIPGSQVTHLLYAFANVQSDGTVVLSDSYADLQKHYPTDSWNDVGNNVYGCIKQLYLQKKANRAMKVQLSIGGWTYSANFAGPASTAAGRTQFAKTAVKFVQDLGLDGLDIDWEFPANAAQASDFVLLLKEVRAQLQAYQTSSGSNAMYLTVACPAGPDHYKLLDFAGMAAYVDFFNLMAYDYDGSWSTITGHQANLYPSATNNASTPFATKPAVDYYLSHGVPAAKLILGMPLYGRDFQNTAGMGKPYSGNGAGSFERGVWDFKALPQAGASEVLDTATGASYSWDPTAKTIVSYDNLAVTNIKTKYIHDTQLGGAMWWELSGDKSGDASLVNNVYKLLTAAGPIDVSQNTLKYPNSQYANMVAGMV